MFGCDHPGIIQGLHARNIQGVKIFIQIFITLGPKSFTDLYYVLQLSNPNLTKQKINQYSFYHFYNTFNTAHF